VTWTVYLHPDADLELDKLPATERSAVLNAVEKLEHLGPALSFPHSSAVRGVDDLRELRPRQGRSPWRAFYRGIGVAYVVGAVGPEYQVSPRGFQKALVAAQRRLEEVEEDR